MQRKPDESNALCLGGRCDLDIPVALVWTRGSSSRSIGLSELHWFVRYQAFFSWRTGLGRFSWALQEDHCTKPPPCVVWNNMGSPSCIPVCSYFCRYRAELVLLHVSWRWKLLGRRWYLLVGSNSPCGSAGISCARVSGRGLLLSSRTPFLLDVKISSGLSPTSHQALR